MKSILRPILMILFVFAMVYLMEEQTTQNEKVEQQKNTIDESSVIYSVEGSKSKADSDKLNE